MHYSRYDGVDALLHIVEVGDGDRLGPLMQIGRGNGFVDPRDVVLAILLHTAIIALCNDRCYAIASLER